MFSDKHNYSDSASIFLPITLSQNNNSLHIPDDVVMNQACISYCIKHAVVPDPVHMTQPVFSCKIWWKSSNSTLSLLLNLKKSTTILNCVITVISTSKGCGWPPLSHPSERTGTWQRQPRLKRRERRREREEETEE